MIGFPFLFEHFSFRSRWVSSEAVVWKKFPGSVETLIAD
jgi:hypothetical protein